MIKKVLIAITMLAHFSVDPHQVSPLRILLLLHHYQLNNKIMQAQLITYQLKDISQPEYLKQMVEPDAPILAKVKGLISKVWLTNEEKNTYGGFYLWENKTAMEDFMHSELVKAVVSRPYVKNVSSVDFEVNETASLITRGLK
jgi:putative monooxygenase ydhR